VTVLSPRACGMSGTAAEWLFQLDHATPYCDNVSVACTTYRLPRLAGCSHSALPCNKNPATSFRLSATARITESSRGWQARAIDGTKGDS
jgi:hypothetical protein